MRLVPSSDSHITELLTWFNNAQDLYHWGAMKQLKSNEDLRQDLRASHLRSFSLLKHERDLVAFGQSYLRLNRLHLGRLAVKPEYRTKGIAKILITNIIEEAFEQENAKGVSLFVFRDNLSAYRCYQSLGFEERDYPGGIPGAMQNCAYMILVPRERPQLSL
jgi:ribosomal protein S18 acetylase RimI-like enzyme